MNLKLSPLHILAFLILLFLVQQIHDWAHVATVRVTCHCWAYRVFDDWKICGDPSPGQQALILISGSLINLVLMWVGWAMLHPESPVEDNSVGIALVFAAQPLSYLIAAFRGGGELTEALAWVQRHGPASNHHFVTRMGLIITLVLVLPALIRAFLVLPGYKGKLIAFPLFLLLPSWLVRLGDGALTRLFITPDVSLMHAYIMVGVWTVLLVIGLIFTARWLKTFINELSL